MQKSIPYQPLKYFSSTVTDDSSTAELLAIFAVAPEDSTPPHLGLNLPQSRRLLAATILLPLLLCGCSTRVDVSTETRTSGGESAVVQKLNAKVGVELLAGRESDRDAPPLKSSGSSIEINGNGNFASIVEGESDSTSPPKKHFWNTKLPWPNHVRGANSWTLCCYLAVWVLVIGSAAVMVHTANRQEEGGPLWSLVAMLAAAAILLQFLPYTDSGIQFIPLSPWCYVGFSFWLSLVSWAAILGAVYVVVDRFPDSPQAFAVLVLIAMGLNAMLS